MNRNCGATSHAKQTQYCAPQNALFSQQHSCFLKSTLVRIHRDPLTAHLGITQCREHHSNGIPTVPVELKRFAYKYGLYIYEIILNGPYYIIKVMTDNQLRNILSMGEIWSIDLRSKYSHWKAPKNSCLCLAGKKGEKDDFGSRKIRCNPKINRKAKT